MREVKYTCSGLLYLLFVGACSVPYNPMEDYEQMQPAAFLETPEPAIISGYPAEQVDRGRYLVGLLGCNTCHTDGALIGTPRADRLLAGSSIGIAYSNPLTEPNPGVLYPPNLTPDPETGIGNWTLDQIINMLRAGIDEHGTRSIPVMPWPAYARIETEEAYAIAAYLKSLAPVRHRVPANVLPGRRATAGFVHFGVYRSKHLQ